MFGFLPSTEVKMLYPNLWNVETHILLEVSSWRRTFISDAAAWVKERTKISSGLYCSDLSKYFIESSYKDASRKTNKCYLVTKMGCELLGNKQQGEKGILFTAKYVERFNQYEEQLKQTITQPQLPQTYLEALKALVASEEEKQKIQEENKRLTKDNNHKDDVIGGLTEEISLADKRQRITQIIRYKTSNFFNGVFCKRNSTSIYISIVKYISCCIT